MKTTAILTAVCFVLATSAAAQDASPTTTVTDTPPPAATTAPGPTETDCPQVKKGGAIAGIVVASVVWWVLPMSIPVWITQAKKLKRAKRELYEQAQRGCPPQY